MTQLKHKFKLSDDRSYIDIIQIDDTCIYCGKNGQQLYNSMTESSKIFCNEYRYNLERTFDTDVELYNEHSPCITYEEYIIKNIIE